MQYLCLYSYLPISGDQGTTISSWYDGVFYGKLTDWQKAKSVAAVRQQRFLDPDDGYTATATVNLDQDEVGPYFVFIHTDIYYQVGSIQQLLLEIQMYSSFS